MGFLASSLREPKRQAGGWAVTLKSASQRGLHPEQLAYNPFAGLLREMHPEITAAYYRKATYGIPRQ